MNQAADVKAYARAAATWVREGVEDALDESLEGISSKSAHSLFAPSSVAAAALAAVSSGLPASGAAEDPAAMLLELAGAGAGAGASSSSSSSSGQTLALASGLSATPPSETASASAASLADMDVAVQAFQQCLTRFSEYQEVSEQLQAVAWRLFGALPAQGTGANTTVDELAAPGMYPSRADCVAAFASVLRLAPVPLRVVAASG